VRVLRDAGPLSVTLTSPSGAPAGFDTLITNVTETPPPRRCADPGAGSAINNRMAATSDFLMSFSKRAQEPAA
jgi:hypothetical protein